MYRGSHAKTYNPLFQDENVTDSSGFVLQSNSPAKETGKLIFNSAHQGKFDYFFSNGGEDYYGNPVSDLQSPNIGAYNGPDISSDVYKELNIKTGIQVYPNPAGTSEIISVILSKTVVTEKISVQIFDITGKSVFHQYFQPGQIIAFNPKFSAKGVYMFQIESGKFNETGKLVIR